MKNKNLFIHIINITLLISFILSFFYKNNLIDNKQKINEVCLNDPKEKINSIKITDYYKNEVLEIDINNYIGKKNNYIFYLDKIKTDTLVEYFRKPIKMYTILDNFNNKSFDDSIFFTELFFELTVNNTNTLYFGNLNDLSNKIYITKANTEKLWQTSSDILFFLTCDESFWCNRDLFINLPDYKKISSIIIDENNINNKNIEPLINFLKPLQSTSIKFYDDIFFNNLNSIKLLSIKINTNFIYNINIYKVDNKIFVRVFDEKANNKYTKEISTWTYDKIIEFCLKII